MKFDSKEICITKGLAKDYRVSICFNGEFHQARLVHPPSPMWNEVGIGKTEEDAVNALLNKINKDSSAA